MAAEPMTINGGTCPSLETIGAFVDGRFKDRERDVIAEHVASCEACYFVFSETARMKATSLTAPMPVVVPPRRNTWRLAAAGLAAAATIVLAVNKWGSFGANRDRRALDQLVAAVGTARTFDPRLTGGFAYAPVRGAVRGSNDTPQLSPDVRIAIAEIEKQNTARPVAASAALIGGDTNRAIDILEAASKTTLDDARIFSDLSAAYLVRAAQRTDNARDLQLALANANRALDIDRLMPEALFNRALALQMLGQASDARIAWESFLTVDDRSGWADEARVRLRILSSQP
jgi:tetratricopeptide (TPR) repeat protein